MSQLRQIPAMPVNFFLICLQCFSHSTASFRRIGSGNGQEHEKAFNQAQQALISSQILLHCDPNLPVKLAADTVLQHIGSGSCDLISHGLVDGSERPIKISISTSMDSSL